MTIWGNHSTTQYPDLFHCEVDGKNAYERSATTGWVDNTFIPTVAKRGAAIIEARGASSAASAANAAIDHMRIWALGTPAGDWVSMAVPSDGCYGVPEGLISSFPCTLRDGSTRSCKASTSTTLARKDRRVGRRAGRGARRGERARPDLVASELGAGSAVATRPARPIMAWTPRFSTWSLMRVLLA